MKNFYYTATAVIMLAACNPANENNPAPAKDVINAFIHPPLKNADVPFEQYSLTAETGDTIFYRSGSVLVFPPNAFVDKNGKVVTGKVTSATGSFQNQLTSFSPVSLWNMILPTYNIRLNHLPYAK